MTERDIRVFLGWLSSDFPELHRVEIGRFDDSLRRFRVAAALPQEPPLIMERTPKMDTNARRRLQRYLNTRVPWHLFTTDYAGRIRAPHLKNWCPLQAATGVSAGYTKVVAETLCIKDPLTPVLLGADNIGITSHSERQRWRTWMLAQIRKAKEKQQEAG